MKGSGVPSQVLATGWVMERSGMIYELKGFSNWSPNCFCRMEIPSVSRTQVWCGNIHPWQLCSEQGLRSPPHTARKILSQWPNILQVSLQTWDLLFISWHQRETPKQQHPELPSTSTSSSSSVCSPPSDQRSFFGLSFKSMTHKTLSFCRVL